MERAKVFEKIIHAEDRRRNRELQATQDAARQKSAARPCTQRGKYGIIRDMKTRVSSALALTLAIAGGLAVPLRSDASVRKDLTPPPRSGVTLSAASHAPRSALSELARAEVRGRVVRMARFLNRKSQRYYRLKFADTYYGEMTHYGLYRLAWADVRRTRT